MSSQDTSWKSQSFPSIDVRIAWALTLVCLVLGLLMTFGVLSVQINPLTGWSWFAIIVAQMVTAAALFGAAHLSSRKRAADPQTSEPAAPMPASSMPSDAPQA